MESTKTTGLQTITRKSLLYRSGIGGFCINHVQGCSHGCRYPCYAYMMAKSYNRVKNYTEWCRPKLVVNAAELLSKELARKRRLPDSIHLCLSTDPFMTGHPKVCEMSLKLIALINSYGVRCSILTKGKLPVELADNHLFSADNLYGISLISLDESFREQWEPGAAPYAERIGALKYLHEQGFRTLAHIEPYPTPNLIRQNLEDILDKVNFVDYLHFSGWNYNDQIRHFRNFKSFYDEQDGIASRYCQGNGIEYNT